MNPKAKCTGQVRKFDLLLFKMGLNTYLRLPRRLDELQALARDVWHAHVHPLESPPTIKFARSGNSYYWSENNTIVLIRSQQRFQILLHELAHAMCPRGYWHGRAFQEKYLTLLIENAEPWMVEYILRAAFESKFIR